MSAGVPPVPAGTNVVPAKANSASRMRRGTTSKWAAFVSLVAAESSVNDGDPIRFYVELVAGHTSLDRAPREGIFELTAPSPDFERIMWQA